MQTNLFDPTTLKEGQKVLWLNGKDVESGDVLFLTQTGVEVIWLEGYKSRNDTPKFSEILAVHDDNGILLEIDVFSGNGWLTAAGQAYVEAQSSKQGQ